MGEREREVAEGKGKGWGVGPAAAVGGWEGRAASHRQARRLAAGGRAARWGEAG